MSDTDDAIDMGLDFTAVMKEALITTMSPDQMKDLNRRGLPFQRVLISAMRAGTPAGIHPSAAAAIALQAMISSFLVLRDKEMVSYLAALTQGMRHLPDGPASLFSGEMTIEAALKPGERIPQELRDRYDIREEFADPDKSKIVRTDNVLDCTEIFAGPRKTETVH